MANVAEGLIELLRACGVERVYGVTGDALFPLLDALGKQQDGGLKFIGTAGETAAAFMASYHAKLTGRLGVCVASSGPGTANLVNGLADAYFDRAPVLAITGQVALDQLGTGVKQEINQQELLTSVTASSQLVSGGSTAMVAVMRAVEKAMRERTVTHIAIPVDVFHHEIAFPPPIVDPATFDWQAKGFSGDIDEAARLLQGASYPLILVGEGGAGLGESVVSLAERIGAGIILAQQAKGLLPDDHPRVLGGIGEAYVPAVLKEADGVLQIGSSAYEKKYFDPTVATVQLVGELGAVDFSRPKCVLIGNLGDMLSALLERLTSQEHGSWQERISQEKLHRGRMIDEQRANHSLPLHPAHVMTVLSDLAPADAVIVCDIGAYVHWFDSYFIAKEQTVMISSHWRSLGAGIPGAIGVAMAQPQRRVVALVGDGGALMSLGELCTAAKYGVPITVVIVNNRHYEIEHVRMEHQGLTPFGVGTPTADFAALAAACGADGRKVTTHDELVASLQYSFESDRTTVLDVHVAQVGLPVVGA